MHIKHNLDVEIVTILVGIVILSGCILSNMGDDAANATSSDLKTATASVTVMDTCSMTANVVSEHVATLANGIYSGGSDYYPNGIGETTISVLCNDVAGYDIYVTGYTDNIMGRNILKNPALSDTYAIASGTATSGDISNWAMKVERVTGTDQDPPTLTPYFSDTSGNGKYVTVPATYQKLASHTSNTNAAIQRSSITTTYAAYIAGTQPAGTYSGQVAYMLVHPNNGSVDDDIKIMQNIAQWKDELELGDEIEAIDSRDGKRYTVARLCIEKDGSTCTKTQIWMTQNLDFMPDTNITYTHADTDLGWSNGDNSITWKPSFTKATVTSSTTVSGWSDSGTAPRIAESGDTIMYNANGTNTKYETNTSGSALQNCKAAGHTESDCLHYQVGNYYNWTAAIASNNSSNITANYTVAPNSICPAGWRLPNGPTDTNDDGTADTASEFNSLLYANDVASRLDNTGADTNIGYATNGFNKIGNSPLYFARSGFIYDSTLGSFGTYGYYWSSTVNSSSYAYNLLYSSGSLYPAYQYDRVRGRSLRCVAR